MSKRTPPPTPEPVPEPVPMSTQLAIISTPLPPPRPRVQPLEGSRHLDETDNSVMACNDYLRMPRRSIRGLSQYYCTNLDQFRPPEPVPTKSAATLRYWSHTFDWQDRAAMYDWKRDRDKDEIHRAAMETGIAAPYQRIAFIKEIFNVLLAELESTDEHGNLHNIWVLEPKEVVNAYGIKETQFFARYNSALVGQVLSLLNDAAKESGGRRAIDPSQMLLDMLLKKVGMQNLPFEVVEQLSTGADPLVLVMDIINRLSPESLTNGMQSHSETHSPEPQDEKAPFVATP